MSCHIIGGSRGGRGGRVGGGNELPQEKALARGKYRVRIEYLRRGTYY